MTVEHRTFCRICLSSCGMTVGVDGGRVVSIRGDQTHPLTHGYLCPKGRALGDTHHAADRLDGAFIGRGADRRAVDVSEAHADLRDTLASIVQTYRVGSIGVFHATGGFMDSGAGWASRRLKKLLGTEHVYSTATLDAIAKTYVAEQMAGTATLIPNIDEENGRLLLFIGVNPVVSHGHSTMYSNPVERIRAARARGPVFVLDPRASETAKLADHHLAARAGSDYAVLAYVLRELLSDDGFDDAAIAQRALGLAALRSAVAPFNAAAVANLTRLSKAQLDGLVVAIRTAGRLAILSGTGSTMAVAGNLTEWLSWALMIVTDSFDQPGGMWFNPGLTTRLDRFDTLPPAAGPTPGAGSRPDIDRCAGDWPASLIPDEIEAGRLRALIVLGGNTVASVPDTERITKALSEIDALIVLEIRRTATTDLATHVFACADQLERPDILGLDLNANAVYQHFTDAVMPARSDRPPMWRTLAIIGQSLGVDLLGGNANPESVSSETLIGRILRGLDIDELRAQGGIRVESTAVFGWVHQRLPLGHWNIAPIPLVEQLRTLAPLPPLVLVPRRPIRRMNTQPFSRGEATTDALMHPEDAAAAGIIDGEPVEIRSTAGQITLTARVSTAIAAGAVSIQYGWDECNVNRLIDTADLDPLTGMARLSGTAITLHRPEPATV